MERFSHLFRVFDPRLRSHQLVMAIGAGSGALSLLIDRDLVAAVLAGVAAAVAWSAARELAPDDGAAAIVAAIAAGIFEAVVGGVGIGAVYVAIVALRIMVRTTGAAPLTTDLIANLPIVVFVSRSIGGLGMSLAVAGALWLSPTLPMPGARAQRWWSAAYAAAAVTGYFALSPGAAPEATAAGWAVAAVSAVLALPLVGPAKTESVGDIDGRRLDDRRLRLGRVGILSALALVTIASLGGSNALLSPVWLAAGASGLRELRVRSAS